MPVEGITYLGLWCGLAGCSPISDMKYWVKDIKDDIVPFGSPSRAVAVLYCNYEPFMEELYAAGNWGSRHMV
jgi:hypothetical protein